MKILIYTIILLITGNVFGFGAPDLAAPEIREKSYVEQCFGPQIRLPVVNC
jgi:hypothetical protein